MKYTCPHIARRQFPDFILVMRDCVAPTAMGINEECPVFRQGIQINLPNGRQVWQLPTLPSRKLSGLCSIPQCYGIAASLRGGLTALFGTGINEECPVFRQGIQINMATTYSPTLLCSTIGHGGLNCSVRNGKR